VPRTALTPQSTTVCLLPDDVVLSAKMRTLAPPWPLIPGRADTKARGSMNKTGHLKTLVPAHPRNTNAVRHGVFSRQSIEPRAAEIEEELLGSFAPTAAERIAVHEVARSVAILDAIDRDLDERGVADRKGEARSLLAHRARMSRRLDAWLMKISTSIERQHEELSEDEATRAWHAHRVERVDRERSGATVEELTVRTSARADVRSGGQPAPGWLRGPREPATAYLAFVVYRDLIPPRSLHHLSEVLELPAHSLEKWSQRWSWAERADAYRAHLEDSSIGGASEDDIIRRRRGAADQLYEIGQALLTIGRYSLIGASDGDGSPVVRGLHPDELSPSEVARFLDLGATLVRRSTGLPSDLSGSMRVTLDQVQHILGGVLELARNRMPPEEHAALVRDCYALVRESVGSV
jgi:hypothetical protein